MMADQYFFRFVIHFKVQQEHNSLTFCSTNTHHTNKANTFMHHKIKAVNVTQFHVKIILCIEIPFVGSRVDENAIKTDEIPAMTGYPEFPVYTRCHEGSNLPSAPRNEWRI